MAEKLILHIGAPKSGTTYLQSILWANQERLRDAGILVPGRYPFDHNRVAQVVRYPRLDPKARSAWRHVTGLMREWPGTVVLSNEWLCMASGERAQWAIDAFEVPEVHVVVTARALTTTIGSGWQESLKLGSGVSLRTFLESLDDPRERWRWDTLDPAEFLPRWQATVPPGHVHLVTIANGDSPELLWSRFSSLLGEMPPLEREKAKPNHSLTAEGARLLELAGDRLTTALDIENGHWNYRYRWIRDYLSHQVLAAHGEHRIALSPAAQDYVRRRSEISVARLDQSDYHVLGNLDALAVVNPLPGAMYPGDVTDDVVLDLAGDVMAAMLGQMRRTHDDLAETKARARDAEQRLAVTEQSLEVAVRHPLRAQARRGRQWARGPARTAWDALPHRIRSALKACRDTRR